MKRKFTRIDAAVLESEHYDRLQYFCADYISPSAVESILKGRCQSAEFIIPADEPAGLSFRVFRADQCEHSVEVMLIGSEKYAAMLSVLFREVTMSCPTVIRPQRNDRMTGLAVQAFYESPGCRAVTVLATMFSHLPIRVTHRKDNLQILRFSHSIFEDGHSSLSGYLEGCTRIEHLFFVGVAFDFVGVTLLGSALATTSSVIHLTLQCCTYHGSLKPLFEGAARGQSVTGITLHDYNFTQQIVEDLADSLSLFITPLSLSLTGSTPLSLVPLMHALQMPNAVHELTLEIPPRGGSAEAALDMLAVNDTLQHFHMPMLMDGHHVKMAQTIAALCARGTLRQCSHFIFSTFRCTYPYHKTNSDMLVLESDCRGTRLMRRLLDPRLALYNCTVVCSSVADVAVIPHEAAQRPIARVVLNKVPLRGISEIVPMLPTGIVGLSIYTCGGDIFRKIE